MSDQTTDPTTVIMPGEAPELDELEASVQQVMADLFLEPEGAGLVFFIEPPLLVPDLDRDRLLARQREMMEALGEPIGEETKEEKQMGLAMQQLDIEQRHALRLVLGYGDDPERLTEHLERGLADPEYGYGPNGDNGRTIAQGLQAIAGDDFAGAVAEWLGEWADFRQAVFDGLAMSMRSMHDVTELETFVPVLGRIGDSGPGPHGEAVTVWRLGIEGEGKHRDFQGDLWDIWGDICSTFVEWYDADNEVWMESVKRAAARLPDTIQRAAWGDRLDKRRRIARLEGTKVNLVPPEDDETTGGDWPRFLTIADRVGLTRLSGHSFYELAWEGGIRVRRFELSSTTRNRIRFEHTELAVRLAEAVADAKPEPASAEEIEGAYLRRMRVSSAELGPPQVKDVPVEGTPMATYRAGDVTVTVLHGGEYLAYAVNGDTAVALHRDERRGVIAALPLVRDRVRRQPLMTTPLDEIGSPSSPEELRALSAWAAWLTSESERK
jgi:hypothetical protein